MPITGFSMPTFRSLSPPIQCCTPGIVSYQSMLEEMEELELSTLLSGVISNMSLQLPAAWQRYGQGPLKDSILDADLYLTVAGSLWAGQRVPSVIGDAGVDQNVATILSAVNGQVLLELFRSSADFG